MPKIMIDRNSCIQCGACADICYARDVFVMNETGPVAVHPELCRLCGHCVAVCPTDSINHEKISIQNCPLIDRQNLPSLDMMINALRARRSYRRYQDRSVPREIIQTVISHSRWIPTGENRQYIDWIAFDDMGKITELLHRALREVRNSIEHGRDASQFLGKLSVEDIDRYIEQTPQERNRFFFNAPVVLAGYCEKNTVCAREEATYAAYNIILTAERMGLGTCHVGSVQLLLEEFPHLQHEVLGISEENELQVLLTLGYPARQFRRMVPRRRPNITWNP